MAAAPPQVPPRVPLLPALPGFTVHDAMVACGVNDIALFDGLTAARRVIPIYSETILQPTWTKVELDSEFKTYSDLSQNQGQVRLLPGTKHTIRAFIQCVRDERHLGQDPSSAAFPVAEAPNLLRRYKTHAQHKKKSVTLYDADKPAKFTSETKLNDWAPPFLNYLPSLQGMGCHVTTCPTLRRMRISSTIMSMWLH
jgi:hypothetical protein